jgi:molecular chaperone GrpE
MRQDFYQNGKWTVSLLADGRWQLEELIKTEDQLGALVLSTNLSDGDLQALQQTIDSALGKEVCTKCQSTHALDEPHHPAFEKWVRSLADYDNLLKRNKIDMAQAQFEASRKILNELLPMMDNIRAVVVAAKNALPEQEIRIVESSLEAMLQKNEVTAMFPEMQPLAEYDPEFHQAIEIMEEDVPTTMVVPLMQGYLWRGKLLRTAQVRIVQPRAAKPPELTNV